HPGAVIYDATVTLKDRKIPYFERKRAGFHSIYDLWEGSNGTSSIYDAGNSSESFGDNKTPVSPVFTDIFTSYTTATGQQAGMPILYFKANRTARFRADVNRDPVDPVANGNSGEYSQWAYNFLDNYPILQLPWLSDTTQTDGLAVHYQDPDNTGKENAQMFYEQLTKRQDGSFYAPYNPNTFIFISAGHDGIFGTKDDLTNFNY
ncbi:MAG: hypothetical protein ACYSUS_06715, partial [Planctomycetota bacterium]